MPVQIDMEMPKNCRACKFCQDDVYSLCYFCFLNEDRCCEFSTDRPDWCPLVEAKEQKWHVVAEGDLPPKPKDGIKRYLVTKQRQNDWSKRIVTALYWDGNNFYNDGLSGSRMRDVLAWRELPEPWEGAEK
ncbi:hypothetical protein LI142_22125 [Eubacterium limosum]|uniref:DUF551 domain-containing protein n=1 Tax=Eubacterium limosum TaxID=1736 RepID=A0ABT5UVD1_EUBLI|nr:hypothetical protein [Eubacterium limosum]MCB6572196.1 hypothetical protein [Eubacterium limosum]MDE1472923.1 hypothetical protein [Eubacterium limosum]